MSSQSYNNHPGNPAYNSYSELLLNAQQIENIAFNKYLWLHSAFQRPFRMLHKVQNEMLTSLQDFFLKKSVRDRVFSEFSCIVIFLPDSGATSL